MPNQPETLEELEALEAAQGKMGMKDIVDFTTAWKAYYHDTRLEELGPAVKEFALVTFRMGYMAGATALVRNPSGFRNGVFEDPKDPKETQNV